MQSDPFGGGGGEPAMWAGGIFVCVAALFGLAMLVLFFVAYWKICVKAGFSGAMALLLLIPGIGPLVLVLYLAFAEWPIHRQLESYRYGDTGAPPPPPGVP